MVDKILIKNCILNNSAAQKQLYDLLSPKMFGVCKRYARTNEDAEDILLKGFLKVFSNLSSYKFKGSFEGWVRRIIVNEALMFLRKKRHIDYNKEIVKLNIKDKEWSGQDHLIAQDILKLLEKLPLGYRTIFNLYVIEGYKHREIGELLGISINTSKSQLILAKKKMIKFLKTINYPV